MKKPSGNKGDELAAVVPALIEYTNRILYDEMWERPILSKRDRSLITVAALIAMYRPEQLTSHLSLAMRERPQQRGDRRGHHASRLLCLLALGHHREPQILRPRSTAGKGSAGSR